MTTTDAIFPGHAVEAGRCLDEAADYSSDAQLRQARALTGIGHALLALGERLDDRLADVADAVTDVVTAVASVQDQVTELRDTPRPGCRRWGRGRGAGPELSAVDMALVRRALADAASWRRVECSADVENGLAHAYLALRERLGGGAL